MKTQSSFLYRTYNTFIQKHALNRIDFSRIFDEIFKSGVNSSFIISISGFFIGIVLTLQGIYMLEQFSSENQVGHAVVLSILREIGPVMTGLLYVGNVCSATTSEIGIMRLTEQHAALLSLGIDPYRYVSLPKFIASTLCLPLLFCIFCTFAIVGSFYTATQGCGIDPGLFWISIRMHIVPTDAFSGLIKTFVFSFFITLTALYFGSRAGASSVSVARATTYCVVTASVLIFILDAMLTSLFLGSIWQ